MRILLADDQERVRYGLRVLLRQQSRWQVVGEADNFKDLLALTAVLEPDLVLLDWNLPDISGESILLALRRIHKDLQVIVLSGQIEVERQALDAGANAFHCKSNPPDQLLNNIRAVMKKIKGDRT